MLGGVLWCAIWARWASLPVAASGDVKPGGELFDLLNVVATVLALIGLTGLHVVQAHRSGRLASVTIGVLWLSALSMAAWAVGLLDSYMFFMGGVIALLAGLIAVTVFTLRAGVLPRLAILPLLVGVLLFPLMNPDDGRAVFALPLGISWIWLGASLRRRILTRSSSGAVA